MVAIVEYILPLKGWIVNIIKKVIDKFLQNTVQPYYEQSQEIYNNNYYYSTKWEPLYLDIKYILHLENIFTNEKSPFSKIFLSSKEKYDLIEFIVEVSNDGIRYQDHFSFQTLDETSFICKSLPSIPLQYIDWEYIYRPYKDVAIIVKKIIKDGNIEIPNHKIFYNNLTYEDIANHEWEKRWEIIYNIESIKRYKYDLINEYESESLNPFEFIQYGRYLSDTNPIKQIFSPRYLYLKLKTRTLIFDLIVLWKMYKKQVVLN